MHSNFGRCRIQKRMFSSIPLNLIFFTPLYFTPFVRRDFFFFLLLDEISVPTALCKFPEHFVCLIQCACFICSVQLLSVEKNYVSQSTSSFSFYLPFLTIVGLRLHVLLVGLATVANETPLRTSSID